MASILDKPNQNINSIVAKTVINCCRPGEDYFSKLRRSIFTIYNGYSSKKLSTVGGFVDYHDASNREAYVLLFFTKHCHAISHGLSPSRSPGIEPHLKGLLKMVCITKNLSLNVCSVGGGPGSDIIGLAMLFKSIHWPFHIRGFVLDQFLEWSLMWEKISSQMNKPPSVHFIKYDVTNNTPNLLHKYAVEQAHIITFVKFVSAVRKQNGAREGMKSLLMHAKPGAYMFYADNQGSRDNLEFFMLIAYEAGFEVVHYSNDELYMETDPIYSAIMILLNHEPKRSVKMTCMLLKKK